jgi:hypothetical protein
MEDQHTPTKESSHMLTAVEGDLGLKVTAVYIIRCGCGNRQVDSLKHCLNNMTDISGFHRFLRTNIENN